MDYGRQKNTFIVSKKSSLKVSSVQEACAKYFPVHILKFEILQITLKKRKKKNIAPLVFKFSPIDLAMYQY